MEGEIKWPNLSSESKRLSSAKEQLLIKNLNFFLLSIQEHFFPKVFTFLCWRRNSPDLLSPSKRENAAVKRWNEPGLGLAGPSLKAVFHKMR